MDELTHFPDLVVELVNRDECLALGLLEVEGNLMDGGKRMNHACHSPDSVDCIEADDCLRHVRHADCHNIAFLDSDCPEGLLSLPDLWNEFGVCGVLVLECQGNLLRILACALKKGIAD